MWQPITPSRPYTLPCTACVDTLGAEQAPPAHWVLVVEYPNSPDYAQQHASGNHRFARSYCDTHASPESLLSRGESLLSWDRIEDGHHDYFGLPNTYQNARNGDFSAAREWR